MAVEYLRDLVGAVEAIEKRVPYGPFFVTVLLSLMVASALIELSRFLIQTLWPVADLIAEVIAAAFRVKPLHLPSPEFPTLTGTVLPWISVAILLAAVIAVVQRVNSRVYAKFKRLEDTIERYDSIFWRPLTEPEKKWLVADLTALGPHTATMDADTSTDCAVLARDLHDCLRTAKWSVTPIRWLGSSGSGAGFFVWYKPSAADFNRSFHNALVSATRGPISGIWLSRDVQDVEALPDIQMVVGPKRVSND